MNQFRLFQLPLRLRLTLWYTLSLGLILLLFSAFLYIQVQRSLMRQVDAALNLTANQALIGITSTEGKLTFQIASQNQAIIDRLSDDYVVYLLSPEGTLWDMLGSEDEIPLTLQPTTFQTQLSEGEPWRIYRQAITIGNTSGWIQVAQELEPIVNILDNLQRQMRWGLPLALLLAGMGGYFLAWRALRPIKNITQTAQTIHASDLTQRIHYEGPHDEIGRLAQTFDTMLDRLQSGFERERRFTGDAAHELRTPLTALKGRIDVTLSQPRQPHAYVATLEEMETQVNRLIRLSRDLLFMARLDQDGGITQQMEPIEVADFLGVVVDQIRPLAAAKTITLIEAIPPNLTLYGDMDLLIRLFLNLLDNAVKYTPIGGQVKIEASTKKEQIEIAISDSGPGIPPEHLPHLFERFYRVERDRARGGQNQEQGGAGLGLAIAYDIVRVHGGELTVHSQLGQGTTFIVQLNQAVSSFS